VSVMNATNYKIGHVIAVGDRPKDIAINFYPPMVYVLNSDSVSVIDGSSDKVQAGVIFHVNPVASGKIICNEKEYPTDIYLYVDAGTYCTARSNNGFLFNTWVASLPTNRNSSIPLESTGNLTVNRYGTFTVNFKPTIPPEYWTLVITVVVTTVIGWSVPSVAGWFKTRRQLKNLNECTNQIGKLDKNAIEDKMREYYVEGKISEEHREFLKDRIYEYYQEEKGSEGYGAPFM
jgi:hypothetical protein